MGTDEEAPAHVPARRHEERQDREGVLAPLDKDLPTILALQAKRARTLRTFGAAALYLQNEFTKAGEFQTPPVCPSLCAVRSNLPRSRRISRTKPS